MSGQSHLLLILQLFDTGGPVWTVEEIARTLGLSVRTAYRNVRELTQAGMLDPVAGAGYVLGPAFIRFDRIIRQTDPLVRVAAPFMAHALEETSQGATVILCRRFRDCVMSVHMVEGANPHPRASYERGAAMSLFRGAPAKVILAFLPDRVLRGLYLRHDQELREAGCESWAAFKEQLRPVKKNGYAMTLSEIGPGRAGIAAPILRGGQVVASISLVVTDDVARDSTRVAAYTVAMKSAAAGISAKLEDEATPFARA